MYDTNLIERFELKFSADQNAALQESFKSFYNLQSAPKVERKLVLEKNEYMKFFKSRLKQRTPFESANDDVDLSFSDFRTPFKFIASWTKFSFPSGKYVILNEELDAPNGLTKNVAAEFGEERLNFHSYFQAEGYVLAKYLEDLKIGNSN